MKKSTAYAALAAGLVVGGLGASLPGAAAASHSASTPAAARTVRVCPANPRPGVATCLAIAVAGANGKILRSAKPLAGFAPADVQKAYNLEGLKSGGATVAIVDGNG
jgi:hypothetical protein